MNHIPAHGSILIDFCLRFHEEKFLFKKAFIMKKSNQKSMNRSFQFYTKLPIKKYEVHSPEKLID